MIVFKRNYGIHDSIIRCILITNSVKKKKKIFPLVVEKLAVVTKSIHEKAKCKTQLVNGRYYPR